MPASELGKKLVIFIKSLSTKQITQMTEQVNNLEWVTDLDLKPSEQLQERYRAFGFAMDVDPPMRWDCTISGLCRDTDMLPHVLDEQRVRNRDGTYLQDACYVDWHARVVPVERRGKVTWTWWFDQSLEDFLRMDKAMNTHH